MAEVCKTAQEVAGLKINYFYEMMNQIWKFCFKSSSVSFWNFVSSVVVTKKCNRRIPFFFGSQEDMYRVGRGELQPSVKHSEGSVMVKGCSSVVLWILSKLMEL